MHYEALLSPLHLNEHADVPVVYRLNHSQMIIFKKFLLVKRKKKKLFSLDVLMFETILDAIAEAFCCFRTRGFV